ncbi:MAG: hypothetical protein M1827_004223 [Pycnora praestabilis]|nr:MAG: hypothetical protein M1827_004223 [Pycnora praestabilis]
MAYQCKLCFQMFPFQERLTNHMLAIHGEERRGETIMELSKGTSTVGQGTAEQASKIVVATVPREFHCDRCAKSYARNNALRRHKKLVHKLNPLEYLTVPFLGKRLFSVAAAAAEGQEWDDEEDEKAKEQKTYGAGKQVQTKNKANEKERRHVPRRLISPSTAGTPKPQEAQGRSANDVNWRYPWKATEHKIGSTGNDEQTEKEITEKNRQPVQRAFSTCSTAITPKAQETQGRNERFSNHQAVLESLQSVFNIAPATELLPVARTESTSLRAFERGNMSQATSTAPQQGQTMFTVRYDANDQNVQKRILLPTSTTFEVFLAVLQGASKIVAQEYIPGRLTGFGLMDGRWLYTLIDKYARKDFVVKSCSTSFQYYAMLSTLSQDNISSTLIWHERQKQQLGAPAMGGSSYNPLP